MVLIGDISFSEVSSIHGTLIDNTGYRNTIRSAGIAYRFSRSPTWKPTVKDSWLLVEWETRYKFSKTGLGKNIFFKNILKIVKYIAMY